MEFINLNIIKNPLNWVIILLMLVIFGMFADLVLRHYGDLQDSLNPHPAAKN
jgi:hypothetical protein